MDIQDQRHALTASDEAFEKYYPDALRVRELGMIRDRRIKVHLPPPEQTHALPKDTLGLALSGGGIRSATFCLGFLQVLAGHNLLRRFDFLSTVSGGGYCGAFLGRWFQRGGAGTEVPPTGQTKNASCDETPKLRLIDQMLRDHASGPVRWLRESGRYMSPTGPGDLRLAFSVYLRNVVTVQLVLAVAFLALFLAAGAVRALLGPSLPAQPVQAWTGLVSPVAGSWMWWSPWLLLPLLLLGLWTMPLGFAYWLVPQTDKGGGKRFIAALRAASPALLLLGAGAVAAYFLVAVTSPTSPSHGLLVTLAIAGGIAAIALLWAGGIGWMAPATARNRLSVWLTTALVTTALAAGFALVDSLGQTVYAVASCRGWMATLVNSKVLPPVAATIAIIAGIKKISALLEFTPGERRWRIPLSLLLTVAAVIVAVVLLTTIGTAANAIMWLGQAPVGDPGKPIVGYQESPNVALNPESLIKVGVGTTHPEHPKAAKRSVWVPALAAAFAAVLSFAIGRVFGFLNLSSHHAFYAARLTRAYLGASNPARVPELDDYVHPEPPPEKAPADPKSMREVHPWDDITFEEYRPYLEGGPLHILNVTINETVRGDSQIEYRDRKGLPMAVGPAGVSVGAGHHARWGEDTKDNGARRQASGGARKLEPIDPPGDSQGRFHPLGVAPEPPWNGDIRTPPGPAHVAPAKSAETRTLGEWVAISGAAFTTGLGYRTSLGASLLLGLSNIRLGYWWDSAIDPRERRVKGEEHVGRWGFLTWPFRVQTYLLSELLARFHGTNRQHWYLSDGGHFENTACYELIRRRVPRIICCDCGADEKYLWEDVANLARKVRIDFNAEMKFLRPDETDPAWIPSRLRDRVGAPETIGKSTKPPKGTPSKPRCHGTFARVYYLDDPEQRSAFYDNKTTGSGTEILFVKPSLSGAEPQDLLEYARTHPAFPQESTFDQDFDEAQWESYRKLGEHTAAALLLDGFQCDPWWKGESANRWLWPLC